MLQKMLAALAIAMAFGGQAQAQTADVARFVDPVSARSAALSPDGNFAAYIRRTDSDQQLIVLDIANRSGRAIQRIVEDEGEYLWVSWKNNSRLILGVVLTETVEGGQRRGSHMAAADEEVRSASVLAMNRDGSGFVQMFEGQVRRSLRGSTFLLDALPNDPANVLLIAEDNVGRGVWRADVNTGRAERVERGPPEAIEYVTDGAGYPVIRVDGLNDGSGFRIYRRANGAADWIMALEARRAAAAQASSDFNVVAAGPGPGQVYVLARAEGQDLAGLYLYDTATGALGAPLFAPRQADADMPWIHPTTGQLISTCEFAQRLSCQGRDATIQRQISAVDGFFQRQATIRLADISDDENRWLLSVESPTEAGGFYLYDRVAGRVSPVADMHPNVDTNALSPTQTITYAARDGAQLWAYVTARPGATGPRAMIVLPHGGPEARDEYGYDSFAQFLASRGYVVLQPNFRGSSGFGRAFADAGRGQWGGAMQNDVTDAVRHMIASGAADPARVCIVGASYGGYAALAGAALTPDLYRCAISIAGVSDLPEMIYRASASGSATRHYWVRSIGDPGANRAALDAVSPRHLAGQIRVPVLLIHGEDDDVVEIRQSELMQQALGRRTRLVRLPDEGHYWDDWSREHRLTVYREVEGFLREHNPAQ
jgi:dipeptidyl aminopeptidase/acylaminoacyl peptidase